MRETKKRKQLNWPKGKELLPQRGNTGGRVNHELTQASGQYQIRHKDEHG